MEMIDYFDAYAACGLKPLPLYPKTKIPMFKGWQDDWSLEKCRNYFLTDNNINIGILLGDVVDVEGDSDFANARIFDLTRGVPHPMFRSSKSVHHLFLTPDPRLTVLCVGEIEFRGHRHQSALPPSTHVNGVQYAWLKGSEFPPPRMPERLLELFKENWRGVKRKPQRPTKKKSGHSQTECNRCKRRVFIHRTRLVLEVKAFRSLNMKWLCQKCRPVDVRDLCREIRFQENNSQDS